MRPVYYVNDARLAHFLPRDAGEDAGWNRAQRLNGLNVLNLS